VGGVKGGRSEGWAGGHLGAAGEGALGLGLGLGLGVGVRVRVRVRITTERPVRVR
jgi:hypothetical protein